MQIYDVLGIAQGQVKNAEVRNQSMGGNGVQKWEESCISVSSVLLTHDCAL